VLSRAPGLAATAVNGSAAVIDRSAGLALEDVVYHREVVVVLSAADIDCLFVLPATVQRVWRA